MIPSGWVSIHKLYIIHYTSITLVILNEVKDLYAQG